MQLTNHYKIVFVSLYEFSVSKNKSELTISIKIKHIVHKMVKRYLVHYFK